jgi:hypothetical protein
MDNTILQKVIKSIQSEYPKTRACTPRVSKQADGRNLITFSFCDTLPGSKSIPQSLRIVVDDQGNIIKKSSSRG